MAIANLARGFTPVFRPAFCCGAFAEFTDPVSPTRMAGTPPFDSHADAVRGQGYFTLSFPLVPNLRETEAHRWMWPELREKVQKKDDVIRLIRIPFFHYVDSLLITVTEPDANALDGVYVTPVSERVTPKNITNSAADEWDYVANTDFDSDLATYGNVTKLPLGNLAADDSRYLLARFPAMDSTFPWSWGHDFLDAAGTAGLDDHYGYTTIGLKFSEGDDDKIAQFWRSKVAVHVVAKVFGFESACFTG